MFEEIRATWFVFLLSACLQFSRWYFAQKLFRKLTFCLAGWVKQMPHVLFMQTWTTIHEIAVGRTLLEGTKRHNGQRPETLANNMTTHRLPTQRNPFVAYLNLFWKYMCLTKFDTSVLSLKPVVLMENVIGCHGLVSRYALYLPASKSFITKSCLLHALRPIESSATYFLTNQIWLSTCTWLAQRLHLGRSKHLTITVLCSIKTL